MAIVSSISAILAVMVLIYNYVNKHPEILK